jgi:hypothetical protein
MSTATIRFIASLGLGSFIILWLIGGWLYLTSGGFYAHVESCSVVVAQQWLHGQPLYPSPDYPDQYGMLYGPFGFVWLAGVLSLVPDPILASKISGGFWAVLAMGAFYLALRRRWDFATAVAGTGLMASELMAFYTDPGVVFGPLSDPILTASVSLGLLAMTCGRSAGTVLLAASFILAIDNKAHALLYFLPILAVWTCRHGVVLSLLTVTASLLMASLLFLLPNVSLANFLFWLSMARHHPFSPSVFLHNAFHLLRLVVLLTPFLVSVSWSRSWGRWSEDQILFGMLLLAAGIMILPTSVQGAGPHHLVPFLPIVAYLFCAALHESPKGMPVTRVVVFALVALFCACQFARDVVLLRTVHRTVVAAQAQAVQADLRHILSVYPPSQIQMGIGDDKDYALTLYSPILYATGQPCVVHGCSYMDRKIAGLGDEPLRKILLAEQYRIWLVPRNDQPFSLTSFYDESTIFSESVRETFAQHYAKTASSPFYDIYQAKGTAK